MVWEVAGRVGAAATDDERIEPAAPRAGHEGEDLFSRRRRAGIWTASVLAGLVVWQFVGSVPLRGSLFFVPFSAVARAQVAWFADGTIWPHLLSSGLELFGGFLLASLVGVAVGGAMGTLHSVQAFLNPWIAILYATPLVAIFPLYILVFGIGLAAKTALVFTLAVFPIAINTLAGFRAAESRYVELGRSFGATRWQMARKILFPSALPFVLSGFRLGFGRGIVAVVVGEFFASTQGIGYLIAEAGATFRPARLYAGVMLLGLVALASFACFDWLERRVSPWKS